MGTEWKGGMKDLEDAITEAGRDDVFTLAKENGWRKGDSIPIYIWWEFVRLANARKDDYEEMRIPWSGQ